MISSLRRYLNTWAVRLLFVLLVASFAIWGVGDVIRTIWSGQENWVAQVGSHTIQIPELQSAYQRQLAQVSRMMGGSTEPTPEIRRSVLEQSLERLVMQAAITDEVQRLGLVVPDDALQQEIWAVPAFQGPSGRFELATFQTVLRNNGLTEPAFLALVRADLGNRQLMESVRAGVAAPPLLVQALYEYQAERRSADIVELPFATAPAPATPGEATLRRWWENHPDLYTTPTFRRVQAVVLSPQTAAKDIDISDADLQAYYDQHRAEYQTEEKRSAQVVSFPDRAAAEALAKTWRDGADWAAVQADAAKSGGAAVALDDAARAEFPAAELGTAVFTSAPNTVSDPVQTPLGWSVVRVVKTTPGLSRTFADVHDELRDRIAAEKGADLIYDRANKLDNLLASGTDLDHLPDDLSLAALTGLLDAQGNTQSGDPAPIPGSPDLKQAMVTAAFAAAVGEPPRMIEVRSPNGGPSSYYALQVKEIIPGAPKPFEDVKDQVLADWTRDAIRHERNAAATAVMMAVKGGETLADAATKAGLRMQRTPQVARGQTVSGMPAALAGPLFVLHPGEPTMVETPDGFVVAVLADRQIPDKAADPAGFGQMTTVLTRALGNDVEVTLASALRDRVHPRVNRAAVDSIIQQP